MVDEDKLREDLHAIGKWATENNMTFNADQFKIMRYSPQLEVQDQDYTLWKE